MEPEVHTHVVANIWHTKPFLNITSLIVNFLAITNTRMTRSICAGCFTTRTLKRSPQDRKNMGISSVGIREVIIVHSERSTLWNHVSGLRFPHGTSMTSIDYVCISLILSKSSTYYVPGVFLCMGHTAENKTDEVCLKAVATGIITVPMS